MTIRIVLAVWATIAVLTILIALTRLAWGLLWGLVALFWCAFTYLLDGLAWLWRQARWCT